MRMRMETGVSLETFPALLELAFIEVPILLFLIDLLLLVCFIPVPDIGHVGAVPLLLFVKLAADEVELLLNFLLTVLLPILDIVQTNSDSQFPETASTANAVPEGVILLGIEEDHQIEFEVDSSGEEIRSDDYSGMVGLMRADWAREPWMSRGSRPVSMMRSLICSRRVFFSTKTKQR
jgi:hypothetical protein